MKSKMRTPCTSDLPVLISEAKKAEWKRVKPGLTDGKAGEAATPFSLLEGPKTYLGPRVSGSSIVKETRVKMLVQATQPNLPSGDR